MKPMHPDKRHGYIVKTAGVLGGKPRIAGHRISVQHIATDYEQLSLSPEEIQAAYPSLTLAQIHAALAYYYDHHDEIVSDRQRAAKLERQVKKQQSKQAR
jgi:uncharacterized protein (DUF433 family)